MISQALLRKKGGKGRVAALEIMIGTPAVRNLIREGKIAQLPSAIQTGQKWGMQTLDQHLKDLVFKGLVDKETALPYASDPELFERSFLKTKSYPRRTRSRQERIKASFIHEGTRRDTKMA